MVNHLSIHVRNSGWNRYENYICVDGKPLIQYLNEWIAESDRSTGVCGNSLGYVQAWNKSGFRKEFVSMVWNRMRQRQSILPILVKKIESVFSQMMIVADVLVENDYVYWRRIGYVLDELQLESKEICWIININWQFDRTEYTGATIVFWEQQTLWELQRISKRTVIDTSRCAEMLAGLTIGGSELLEKHRKKYGEIQLSVLVNQLVVEPFIMLLKEYPNRYLTINVYRAAIRAMYLYGSKEVSGIVKSKLIPELKTDKQVWTSFGRFFYWLERERLFKWRLCIGLLVVVAICCYAKRNLPVARTDFESFEQFEEMGGETDEYGLPENATDVKYYLSDPILYRHSIYAFTIEDDEEYEAYIQEAFGGFEEQRLYARDYVGVEDSYAEFPMIPYEKVIEDDIMEYTILRYYPATCCSSPRGILVNEETHRFVVFWIGQLKE